MLRLLTAFGVVVLAASSPHGVRALAFERTAERASTPLAAPSEAAGALPPRDDELPWCVGDDDPRCAPLHDSSGPMGTDLRIAAGVVGDAPAPAPQPKRVQKFTPRVGPIPHAGFRHRVERPPRAG